MSIEEGNTSSSSKTFKGIIWNGLQQFGTLGIQFIISIFLARLLLPKEFGLIGMITIFIHLGQIFVHSGMGQSLIRTKVLDNRDLSTIFHFNLVMSLALYALVYFIAPLVSQYYEQEILTSLLRVYSIIFVINSFGIVQIALLTRSMNFKRQALITIISLIIGGCLGIYLAFRGFGVWSLVWNQLAFALIANMLYWFSSKWHPTMLFDKKKFHQHFGFGFNLTLKGILNTVTKNLYYVVIGKYFSAAQLGYYTRAISFRDLPANSIATTLNKVTYPLFASIENDIELKRKFRQITGIAIFLMAPLMFVLALVAEPLIELLFSSKWLPAVPYFQILCFAGILIPIQLYNLNILLVKGRSDLFLKLSVIKKIILVIILVISFQRGIIGIICGQVLNSIISYPINAYYLKRFINYSYQEQLTDLMTAIFLSILIAIVVYYIDINITVDNNLLHVLFILGSYSLLYIATSKILKIKALNSILDQFSKILTKFKK